MRRFGRNSQRGGAYLLAITLTITIVIALVAVMELSQYSFRVASSQDNGEKVYDLAEAGINRGIWEYANNNQIPPFTVSENLGGGNYSVTVTDNKAAIKNSIKLVSTASYQGKTQKLTKVLGTHLFMPLMFDVAIFSQNDFITNRRITTVATTYGSDIFGNDDVSLTNTSNAIGGDVYAKSTASATNVTGKTKGGMKPVTVHTINLNYYYNNDHRFYSGSRTFAGFVFFRPYEVVTVKGDLTLNAGVISGTGTIVVEGKIFVNGNLAYLTSSDKVAFLAKDGITFNGSRSVVGIYYCNDNDFISNNNVTILKGCVAARNFNLGGNLSVTYDDDLAIDENLGANLSLPGY